MAAKRVKVQYEKYSVNYQEKDEAAEIEVREKKSLVFATRLAEDGYVLIGPRALPLLGKAINAMLEFFNSLDPGYKRLPPEPTIPKALKDTND